MSSSNLSFHYYSRRARKARAAYRIEKFHLRILFVLIIIACIAGGAALFYFRDPRCWFLFSLAAPFLMLLYWHKRGLHHLKVTGTGVDQALSEHLLCALPRMLTLNSLAKTVARSNTVDFMMSRFSLPDDFIIPIAAEIPPEKLAAIWEDASNLRQELELPVVTSGCCVIAIVRAHPNYERILAEGKLSIKDLIDGVLWRERIHALEDKASEPKLTGGIARDWSFGYVPLLQRFGRNISAEIGAYGDREMTLALPSRVAIVEKLITLLSSGSRRNAVIVGPAGSGKATVVHDFAKTILTKNNTVPTSLRYNQVYLLDPTSLIAAAPGRGELEELMKSILVEASVSRNSIICLDGAEKFFSDETGSVDIMNILVPVLQNNSVRIILTMDEQCLLELERKNPNVVNLLDRINIESATYEETLAAMEDRTFQLERQSGAFYTFQALTTAYRLGERYVHEIAMPGAALKLLASAVDFSPTKIIDTKAVETAISQSLGIKVGVADDVHEKDTLLNLETLIHEHVIGQDAAVVAVSNALRRARAGVRNQSKPVGAFLFLGPTGVGKTELAKSLARVYYGGAENLIRVDMNQFVTPDKVADLTADPADNPTSLTAQVMKNPFSVILLDEIEKAHPAVLAALLQVLDEGVLRDSKSREVDFRDAIIVATSNAGADIIREHIANGEKLEEFRDEFVNQLIDSKQFLPEFLNRFDEIIVFSSLSQADLQQVVSLIIDGVNKTLEPQKIRVNLTAEALDKLVDIGYDPRLGARPLRRIVQKTVENKVATAVISGEANAGDVIHIPAEEIVV